MKNLLMSFMLAFTISIPAASQDWANLTRYAAENKLLGPPQTGEKRVDPHSFKGSFIGRGISGQTMEAVHPAEKIFELNGLKSNLGDDGVHPKLTGYKAVEPIAEKEIAEALKKKSERLA